MALLWLRGEKKVDTKIKKSAPEGEPTVFNEKYMMKTSLEFDLELNKYVSKPSKL